MPLWAPRTRPVQTGGKDREGEAPGRPSSSGNALGVAVAPPPQGSMPGDPELPTEECRRQAPPRGHVSHRQVGVFGAASLPRRGSPGARVESASQGRCSSTCGRPPGVAPPRPLLPINEEGSASAPAPHPPASAWEEELASQAPFPPRSVHSAQLEGGSRRCLGNKAGGPESGLWTSWGSMGGLGCEPQGVGRVTCVFKRKRIQLRMFHRNLGPDVMPCVGFLGPQRRGVGGGSWVSGLLWEALRGREASSGVLVSPGRRK